ncbi:MAG: binding-protein-dependent transport system inner rane component [Solirubrobacterales bacterium]|nr:binding-protein-dependent transport system inner rane component [Solirubrobacterales bacterium]
MAGTIRLGPIRPARPRARESIGGWRWGDRIAFVLCWAAGLMLCLIAAAIVGYMLYKGLQYLSLDLLVSHPVAGSDQRGSGGFLDPILGTIILTIVGIAIATPIGVAAALWLVEYGRPKWLARMVESGIEIIAGTPDIVLAIFGLVLFQQGIFSWMSFTAEGGAVFGRSFLTAGCMMSLIALPMVFGLTREGLQSIPSHLREASYGLGKTKIATIRRVLLPAVRPNIGTGMALGMGRIAGDTAIVVILLGATLTLEKEGTIPGVGTLRGTGSTLTSYVYNNSPAGEGNAPEKAYAAAFVLLVLVIGLNFCVDVITRDRKGSGVGALTK